MSENIFNKISYKKHWKHLLLFIWISISLHLYLVWFAVSYSQYQQNNRPQESNRRIVLQNIILDTKTESTQKPENAHISDKNNINKSTQQDLTKEEIYNFANLNEAEQNGEGGTKSGTPQIEQQESQKEKQAIDSQTSFLKKEISQEEQKQQQQSEGGGEVAPTLFDVKKRPVVNLYNNGSLSVATQSKEYADYFLQMKSKVEQYHRQFFPVYQYYQGLLKNGEVVVEYVLNQQGDIVDAKVVSSYGSSVVDDASLNSIKYAKTFGPLPKDFKDQEEIVVRFHFIYLNR